MCYKAMEAMCHLVDVVEGYGSDEEREEPDA
jgi:hypothetical protein